MKMNIALKYFPVFFVILPALMLSGCDQPTAQKKHRKDKHHLVETIQVEHSDIGISQLRTGTLKARHEIEIYNQEEGRITELPFYEGDRVSKGDLIVQLDGNLLRAQLDRAVAKRRQAEQDLKRLRELFTKKLTTEEALSRGETELAVARADEFLLKTRFGYTRILSPIDGLISVRNSEPGNIAERYTHLLTISDHGSLITRVDVSELLLQNLSVGQAAGVRIDALGDKVYSGRISRIHPNLDPVSRRGTVEIELDPVPAGARPGQLCRVSFDRHISDRLMIPFRALRRDQEGEYVFVVTDQSTVQRQAVTSGQRSAEQVEIRSGLEPGQTIVTRGFLDIRDSKKVRQIGDPKSK
ncbi:MAG TPA: efflux transporter periplasmic adaptor subunit [Gammaproteobacteria bacterium]|nr:efflux transporter periplasmic adaptor subunit [Gammaproteobacteria bacterium]